MNSLKMEIRYTTVAGAVRYIALPGSIKFGV